MTSWDHLMGFTALGLSNGMDFAGQIVNDIAGNIADYHSADADSEYAAGYNRALADVLRKTKEAGEAFRAQGGLS